MKIYTKKGDMGQTDLFGGERVSKASLQVQAYGAVDHANASLGFVLSAEDLPETISKNLKNIMNRLFDIGSELSTANIQKAHDMRVSRMGEGVGQADVSELEKLIDGSEAKLEPLKNFILPIGCEAACRFHLARSAVRQAEVAVIEYVEELPSPQTAKSTEHSDVQPNDQGLRPEIIAYLNRLSDLLFSWSRLCNAEAQIAEEPWVKS